MGVADGGADQAAARLGADPARNRSASAWASGTARRRPGTRAGAPPVMDADGGQPLSAGLIAGTIAALDRGQRIDHPGVSSPT